jgi:hypothetical protein
VGYELGLFSVLGMEEKAGDRLSRNTVMDLCRYGFHANTTTG